MYELGTHSIYLAMKQCKDITCLLKYLRIPRYNRRDYPNTNSSYALDIETMQKQEAKATKRKREKRNR